MTAMLSQQPSDCSLFQQDIEHLNQSYLMLCWNMAASNPDMARISLGLPLSVINALTQLSLTELQGLIRNCDTVVTFQSRFGPAFWNDLIKHSQVCAHNQSATDRETRLYVLGHAAAAAPA